MRNWIVACVVWFVVLVVVLEFISFLTVPMAAAGGGVGTGWFSHSFSARLHGRKTISVLGEAPSRFAWSGHYSPEYESVELQWYLFVEGLSDDRAEIDLVDREILHHDEQFPLNRGSLTKLLDLDPTNEHDALHLDGILHFLDMARGSELPPPQHHGIHITEPIEIRMHHFASGYYLTLLELIWTLFWMTFGLICAVTEFRQHRQSHESVMP